MSEHAPQMLYPHVAARLFNTPLMIEAEKLRAIAHGLSHRFGVELIGLPVAPQALSELRNGEPRKPYQIVNGIAVIPVFGGLVHRSGHFDAQSMPLTSYESIGKLFDAALTDDEVSSILFHLDSPGGEAQGVFDLADKIRKAQANTDKPVNAFTDMAASAGYLIASAADQLFVSQSASVGSIGVRMLHVDQSRMNDAMGLTVTELFAGARKIDGTPHAPLNDASLAALLSRITDLYDLFVDAVSTNRGITTAVIRGTEAGIYIGAKAIPLGLADGVRTLDQLLALPSAPVRVSMPIINTKGDEKREDIMEKFESKGALVAAYPAFAAEITTEAVTAERTRIKAILTRVPKGQEQLAQRLAFEDSCSPGDAALQFLDAQTATRTVQLASFLKDAPNPVEHLNVPESADTGRDAAALMAHAAEQYNQEHEEKPRLSVIHGGRA